MESRFLVEDGLQEQVHSLVKKYNLRYLYNPINYFGRWNFSIQGSVEDYNNFKQKLDIIEQAYKTNKEINKEENKLIRRILNFIKLKVGLKNNGDSRTIQ